MAKRNYSPQMVLRSVVCIISVAKVGIKIDYDVYNADYENYVEWKWNEYGDLTSSQYDPGMSTERGAAPLGLSYSWGSVTLGSYSMG